MHSQARRARHEVPVCQHRTLRIARGARRVKYHRQMMRFWGLNGWKEKTDELFSGRKKSRGLFVQHGSGAH